jgi:hypothetical protein
MHEKDAPPAAAARRRQASWTFRRRRARSSTQRCSRRAKRCSTRAARRRDPDVRWSLIRRFHVSRDVIILSSRLLRELVRGDARCMHRFFHLTKCAREQSANQQKPFHLHLTECTGAEREKKQKPLTDEATAGRARRRRRLRGGARRRSGGADGQTLSALQFRRRGRRRGGCRVPAEERAGCAQTGRRDGGRRVCFIHAVDVDFHPHGNLGGCVYGDGDVLPRVDRYQTLGPVGERGRRAASAPAGSVRAFL